MRSKSQLISIKSVGGNEPESRREVCGPVAVSAVFLSGVFAQLQENFTVQKHSTPTTT